MLKYITYVDQTTDDTLLESTPSGRVSLVLIYPERCILLQPEPFCGHTDKGMAIAHAVALTRLDAIQRSAGVDQDGIVSGVEFSVVTTTFIGGLSNWGCKS